MTVKEIKDYYFKFLKITIKPKINVPDSHEITESDIENGIMFQKYIPNDALGKIVNGFKIIDHKIYYIYTNIDRIEIVADDLFPACGGESKITTNAVYTINGLSTSNDNIILDCKDTCSCPVNALIKIDNPSFTYDKPYLINEEPNNTDENKVVTVNATYYHKGIKYEASKTIIQKINSYSSWLVEEEPTQYISLTLSENEISNKGGFINVKVERAFSRIYCMKDSCGNKVGGKSEPGLIEDITNKCLITSSNKKYFNVNKNIISVAKQEIGAPSRETTITARYLDKTDSATLVQKKGGTITYSYDLSFIDGKSLEFLDLETSIPTERKIQISSKQYEYVDGKYYSTTNTKKLKIESDSNWVYGVPVEDKSGIYISVITKETNTDKDNDREATLTITNVENPDLFIKLIVSQQALEVIKEDYYCIFVSDGEYTTEELDSSDLYFHPYKVLTYEDRSTEETTIEDYLTFKYLVKSLDPERLYVNSIIKKGENYHLLFKNFSLYSMKDIAMNVKLIFYDENEEKVFESNTANITVKGNQIVDYNYELCFEGHNKFEEVEWLGSKEQKYIKVNSLKHKLINGKYAGKKQIPYKISIYDNNGKEIFDNNFSVKIENENILVFPINVSNNISNTYIITQKESGLQISFNLSYKINKPKIKIPLKVITYSNVIGKDIWTGEGGYLLIDKKEKIKLNPCWLSPTMKDNVDVAYNGIIELEEGIHTFETFNVLCLDSETKTHKDCNIYKEIFVDKTTGKIMLQIKI